MSRIKCKAGDKVVLYRKDDVFNNVPLGTVFTVLHCGDGPFAQLSHKDYDFRFIPRTHLRHLRKTDAGAKVVIVVRGPQPLFHTFADGLVGTITGETLPLEGETVYRILAAGSWKQYLLPSQFKLAKEQ